MNSLSIRHILAIVALVFGVVAVADDKKDDPATPAFTKEQIAFYEKDVLPLLKEHCIKCHGGEEKLRGDLNLTNRKDILDGGEGGAIVDLESPADSRLLIALHYKDDNLQMPPKGKLADKDIATLEKWVKDGLPMPPDRKGEPGKTTPKAGVVTEEAKKYWAYQPVRRPTVPVSDDPKAQEWVRTPIDAFILAKLEAKGLKPVKPADKAALARRAYYDLLGLPPTPEQLDEFVNDKAPDAWEKLIDTLLASPHYGEKWGRHWLDVVRYAETNGYERDGPKPFVWRYRDYVIQSFNADKPYTQFIREQLAGDEIPGFNPDAVIATGYYRLGLWDDEPADRQLALYDGYDDFVTTTGQTFLGMTLNCARCHDHKADPIPQADYYKMVAFFRDIRPYSNTRDVRSPFNITDISPPKQRELYEKELKQREERLVEIRKAMTAIEDEAIKTLPAEDQRAAEGAERPNVIAKKVVPALTGKVKDDYAAFQKERTTLEKKPTPPGQQLALSVNNCDPRPPVTNILTRGIPAAKGKEVQPGFPAVLGLPDPTIPAAKAGAKTSGRRTVLANWVASKDNPFTARVFVNRVWQYHFGRGIVPSANDFGKFGELPTHPELLDWLAAEFMDPTPQPPPRGGEGLNPDPTPNPLPEVERGLSAPPSLLGKGAGGLGSSNDPTPNPLPEVERGLSAPPSLLGKGAGGSSNDPTPNPLPEAERGLSAPPSLLGKGAGGLGSSPWTLKRLHKLIMMSSVYRLSANTEADNLKADPSNALLWRFNMRRLTGEEVRDTILAVSGSLNPKQFGPSTYPKIPREVLAGQSVPGQGWPTSPPDEANRRSVYVHVKRSLRVPILVGFDQPDPDSSCPVRYVTTVPTQSLGLLNGEFANEQAAAFAKRLRKDSPNDLTAQIERAIRLTTGRTPTADELKKDAAFIAALKEKHKLDDLAALTRYCLLCLNANEFVYLD